MDRQNQYTNRSKSETPVEQSTNAYDSDTTSTENSGLVASAGSAVKSGASSVGSFLKAYPYVTVGVAAVVGYFAASSVLKSQILNAYDRNNQFES